MNTVCIYYHIKLKYCSLATCDMWIGNISFWSLSVFSLASAQIMATIDFMKMCVIVLRGWATFLCILSVDACIDACFKVCTNKVCIRTVAYILRFAYFVLDSYSEPPVLQFACSEHGSVHFEEHLPNIELHPPCPQNSLNSLGIWSKQSHVYAWAVIHKRWCNMVV